MASVTDRPDIAIDIDAEQITLFGVTYALDVFRGLGIAPVGTWFQLVARTEDGAITLKLAPRAEETIFLVAPDQSSDG